MQEICNAEQPYFDFAENEIEQILCRAFITLADEIGVERFEKVFGIAPQEGQTLEQRRIAVLIKASKKNLNLSDVTTILFNYSNEITLLCDYDKDELGVEVGESVDNVLMIYDTLDNLISLQVYIYFMIQTYAKMEFQKKAQAELELKMYATWWQEIEKRWEQKVIIELEATTKIPEITGNIELISQKDLWYLDGSVLLDGSRLLSAIEEKEEL